MSNLLYQSNEWTVEDLDRIWESIDSIGQELKLDYYRPIFEIVSYEQMLDAYTTHGLPVFYNHWSFGKNFINQSNSYKKGWMGLAYEIVINTDPSIAYLMDTNSTTMQALVMAHAVCGHSTFFKNNYMFKEWSSADYILDYLKYAKKFIANCEEKYGAVSVEVTIDQAHMFQYNSIDKHKPPKHLSEELQKLKDLQKAEYKDQAVNSFWDTVLNKTEQSQRLSAFEEKLREANKERAKGTDHNLLRFIAKHGNLKAYEKEIFNIVQNITQYFYPQMCTQLMNEGYATYTHHKIIGIMHDRGMISDGNYLEFIQSHSGVIYQPPYNSPYYSGINVYALGFAMFKDIERICLNPDEEDKRLFPSICNTDPNETIQHIIENYRDDSFVLQFLSPKVVRSMKLFSTKSDQNSEKYEITSIQNEDYLHEIRKALSDKYNFDLKIPKLELNKFEIGRSSVIELRIHKNPMNKEIYFNEDTETVLMHLSLLFREKIVIIELDEDGCARHVHTTNLFLEDDDDE